MPGGAVRSGKAGPALGLAAAALVGVTLLAPGAQASPPKRGVFTFPASGPKYEFSLRDKAGFRLRMEADPEGSVTLSVSRHRQSNAYLVRGKVSKDGDIAANLGRFGRVAVEFRPAGKPKSEKPFPGCHGGPAVTETGVFVGQVRFRGEGGFVAFAAARARGEVKSNPRWKCPGLGHGGGGGKEPESQEREQEAVLSASRPDGSLGLVAIGARGREFSPSLFFASSHRRYGSLFEFRSAFAVARSPQGFEFDEGLTSATVRPGAPFHGSAAFQRGAADSADSWTGSLRVSFLGGDEALTGGRIEASLTRPPKSGSAGIFVITESRGRQALLRRAELRSLSLP